MTDDSVTLAAAWRDRVDRGEVTVSLTNAGWSVKLRGTTVATYAARYRADAHAEQTVRKLYDMTRQDTTP